MIDKKNMDENMEMIIYEEGIALVKKKVEDALTRSPYIIREYLTHLASSQGKYIRAASIITCAQDKECRIPLNAIRAAAAVEILHLASLVHDDIIDNADIRRGKATLQKKYGKRTAVICGDYLLSLALKQFSDVPDRKEYIDINIPDYINKLCLGELEQHINNRNINLSVYRYLKIISGKTAALFEASFFAGAVLSNSSELEIKKYRQIGHCIGMIFQLLDDCIDFDTTVEVANKPVQSDYEQGTITLPLIHAFENLSDFKQKAACMQVTRQEINEAVEKAGGLAFTKMIARKYYHKAMGCINELDITEVKKADIIAILNKASRIE